MQELFMNVRLLRKKVGRAGLRQNMILCFLAALGIFLLQPAFAKTSRTVDAPINSSTFRNLIQNYAPLPEFVRLFEDEGIKGDSLVVGDVTAARYALVFERYDLLDYYMHATVNLEESAVEGVYREACVNFFPQAVEILKRRSQSFIRYWGDDKEVRIHCLNRALDHLNPSLISIVIDARPLNSEEMMVVERRLQTHQDSVRKIKKVVTVNGSKESTGPE